MLTVLAAAGALLLGTSKGASAMTTDGTLVTNIASATFGSVSGMPFTVSYCSTANFIVVSPCVAMWKSTVPWSPSGVDLEYPVGSGDWWPVQSSGCLVTYEVGIWDCNDWSSAFNVTLTDKLPDNTAFVQDLSDFNGNTPYNWIYNSYSFGAWNNNAPMPAGQTGPAYMRWVLRVFGLKWRSAYVRYVVRVL